MERIQQITTNKERIIASLLSFFFLFVLILPLLTNAALVNCGNDPKVDPATGKIVGGCTFTDFIILINNIINWIISIATSIFTIMAVYGGFLYMTSGDNPGNKGKAVSILWNTLKGFVIILCAWLIVYTLLKSLVPGGDSNPIFRFLKK